MKSRIVQAVIVLLVLACTGWLGSHVGHSSWSILKADMPVLTAADVEVAAGEGIMVGLLGGFRAVTADFVWVRTNAVWEEQDLPGTQTLIKLATTVDSRPLLFWINGARMIGYDMPVWRIDALGRDGKVVPSVVRAQIFREQAEAALAVLARARVYHPDDPLLLIEMGNIRSRKMGDLAGGAELYRQAALMPRAPFYAGRIYAEMLKQLGRDREAYDWLVGLHKGLPASDPTAFPELVLERIRDLEERLGIADGERYRPQN